MQSGVEIRRALVRSSPSKLTIVCLPFRKLAEQMVNKLQIYYRFYV